MQSTKSHFMSLDGEGSPRQSFCIPSFQAVQNFLSHNHNQNQKDHP
jgi:hypothetical protein